MNFYANRWILFSAISCFISLSAPVPVTSSRISPLGGLGRGDRLHPFHVSTTEINHNSADKTLEISCKIFIDDFESCLSKQYHTKADLSAANVKSAMDTLVKKYLNAHLQIKADDKAAIMSYLGFEKEDDAVDVYLEVDNVVAVKKVDVNDSILHDMFDDQISIIHVIVGGNRKSTKLDYPNKAASFTF